MHPPGFYKIVYKGMPGVGFCRHRRRWQTMEHYEEWSCLLQHESGRAVNVGVPQGSQFLEVVRMLFGLIS